MIKSLKYNSLISLLPNFSLIFLTNSLWSSSLKLENSISCISFARMVWIIVSLITGEIFVKSSKEISFINSKSMVQCVYFCLPACGKLRIKGSNE